MKRFRSHISILTKHLGIQHTDTSEKLVHRYSTNEQQTCFRGAFFRKGCPEVLQLSWDIILGTYYVSRDTWNVLRYITNMSSIFWGHLGHPKMSYTEVASFPGSCAWARTRAWERG